MASEKKIAACRLNSQKSTGPKTSEGRERSSMNAYKHGMRSKKRAILRGDSYAFENRKQKWMARADPCDDMSEFLVYQHVCAAFEIEHAVGANIERITTLVETSDDLEIERVYELGRRLFFDRCGPTAMYGNPPDSLNREERKQKTSSSVEADAPAKLVAELEKTAPGCLWMLARWEDLRERLEPGKFWQALKSSWQSVFWGGSQSTPRWTARSLRFSSPATAFIESEGLPSTTSRATCERHS